MRSLADGYTLLMGAPAAINATLYGKLNYNFIRDIAPVAGISREPQAMVVNPFRANTVPDFIALPKRIQARLPWRRVASAVRDMWPASCSR